MRPRSLFRLYAPKHRGVPVQHTSWSYGFDDTAGGGLAAFDHQCWCGIGVDHDDDVKAAR